MTSSGIRKSIIMKSLVLINLTRWSTSSEYDDDNCTRDGDSQEDYNKKDKYLPGSVVHDM